MAGGSRSLLRGAGRMVVSGGVHIVTTGFVPRDAISQHVIEEQRVIRATGLRCEIFAEPNMTHPAFRPMARAMREWHRIAQSGDSAILHYSIANPNFAWVVNRAKSCGLTYHNITPPEYLWKYAPRLALECLRGRRHLRAFADQVVATAADSEFNAHELREMGFPEPSLVGILRPSLPEIEPPTGAPRADVRMLFVGRGVPNKAQHELILVLASLREDGVDACLQLVGSWEGLEGYRHYCDQLVTTLGLGDAVDFPGSVTDEELAVAYASADVFVCLSDHEGFCAPLVEAMAAGLPIVAYAAGGVSGTVGEAAILLDDKSPSVVAEAIIEALGNESLRRRMTIARQERLVFHGTPAVSERLLAYVERLL